METQKYRSQKKTFATPRHGRAGGRGPLGVKLSRNVMEMPHSSLSLSSVSVSLPLPLSLSLAASLALYLSSPPPSLSLTLSHPSLSLLHLYIHHNTYVT